MVHKKRKSNKKIRHSRKTIRRHRGGSSGPASWVVNPAPHYVRESNVQTVFIAKDPDKLDRVPEEERELVRSAIKKLYPTDVFKNAEKEEHIYYQSILDKIIDEYNKSGFLAFFTPFKTIPLPGTSYVLQATNLREARPYLDLVSKDRTIFGKKNIPLSYDRVISGF